MVRQLDGGGNGGMVCCIEMGTMREVQGEEEGKKERWWKTFLGNGNREEIKTANLWVHIWWVTKHLKKIDEVDDDMACLLEFKGQTI